tara:strand:- start:146 stop:421 length:276 start_codon:yes stop_codon:yes gene_type:complete
MSMPKGFKVENGYATAAELGGKSYHQIADIMSVRGFKMNHSTARNITVDSLKKLAQVVADFHDIRYTEKELIKIAKNPDFQSGICDIIKDL